MRKKDIKYKECKVCGTKFKVKNYNQKFCSPTCRNEFHNAFKARAVEHYLKLVEEGLAE